MGAAPNRCPVCGEVLQWKLVDTSKEPLNNSLCSVSTGCTIRN